MSILARVLRRLDDGYGIARASCGFACVRVGTRQNVDFKDAKALPETIVDSHNECPADHVNRTSFRDTFKLLSGAPAVILETGSSAWGVNSTCLWDRYVRHFGGAVWSVDIRRAPSRELQGKVSPATTLVTDDSVRFLKNWVRERPTARVALVYLDSWDLDTRAPMASALHCVREYLAVEPLLKDGALLLVDDTPGSEEWLTRDIRPAAIEYKRQFGLWPGKGMLLDLMLAQHPRVDQDPPSLPDTLSL